MCDKYNPVKDCATFSGPISADILACLAVDQSTCGAILQEECTYQGEDRELQLTT